MGLIIGQGTKSGGGGGGASATEFQQIVTLNGQAYNLFDEVKKIRKDNRANDYAVVIMGLYYKGYNSLLLKGADAYITCDGDFYEASSVTEEITHYWHDDNDKIDRYVVFLQKNKEQDITFDNGDTMPRALVVDGECGIINWPNPISRFKYIYTTENSVIKGFGFANAIKGAMASMSDADIYFYVGHCKEGHTKSIANSNYYQGMVSASGAQIVNIGVDEINYGSSYCDIYNAASVQQLILPTLQKCNGSIINAEDINTFAQLISIKAPNVTHINILLSLRSNTKTTTTLNQLRFLTFPNLLTINKLCNMAAPQGYNNLIHFEIGNNFNSNLDIKQMLFANCLLTDTSNLVENVKEHPDWSNLDQFLYNFEHLIVDKLADLTGQTAKTITLAAAPYAAITDAIKAKISAKNWNLASA